MVLKSLKGPKFNLLKPARTWMEAYGWWKYGNPDENLQEFWDTKAMSKFN